MKDDIRDLLIASYLINRLEMTLDNLYSNDVGGSELRAIWGQIYKIRSKLNNLVEQIVKESWSNNG